MSDFSFHIYAFLILREAFHIGLIDSKEWNKFIKAVSNQITNIYKESEGNEQ